MREEGRRKKKKEEKERRRKEEKREVGKRNAAKASSDMGVKRKKRWCESWWCGKKWKNCNGFHASALMVLQMVLRSGEMKRSVPEMDRGRSSKSGKSICGA